MVYLIRCERIEGKEREERVILLKNKKIILSGYNYLNNNSRFLFTCKENHQTTCLFWHRTPTPMAILGYMPQKLLIFLR